MLKYAITKKNEIQSVYNCSLIFTHKKDAIKAKKLYYDIAFIPYGCKIIEIDIRLEKEK